MADLRWNGDAARKRIESEMHRRLEASALIVQDRAKALISTEGTGVRVKGQIVQSTSGKGTRKKLIHNAFPSAPGEPPHVQTGRLRGSVAHESKGLVARVGTNVRYGRWLELGTAHMAARPWLRRALAECQGVVKAILGRPIEW